MNSLRIAPLHLSPLRVQQGLFASLIALLTLLGAQQLQRWEQAQEAAAIHQTLMSHASLPSIQQHEPVSVPATANKMPVDRLVSQNVPAQPYQQRWVF